jgi:hypothetical protein
MPLGLDNTGKAFLLQDELYRDAPFSVPPKQLVIGIGEREPNDPLILLLKQKGMDVAPFLKPVVAARRLAEVLAQEEPELLKGLSGFEYRTPNDTCSS